ncbi:MAG TPA: 4Fe-4S dicluster domain-containing protein [bacterium]|nr:4Fe-4S dicluster domain-containing protein [bacterium]
MAQYGFYFDQSRCTGCFTCQVACKDWHDIEAGQVNWMKVIEIEEGQFPHPFLAYLTNTCYHCARPACMNACPANAISKRERDGVVIVDHEKCLGREECGALCHKACPWKAPQFNSHENAKMQKCDLCFERLEQGLKPICVEACPMFALDAGPMEELEEKYGKNTHAKGFNHSKKLWPSIVFKSRLES